MNYHSIQLEFENEGESGFVEAKRDENTITVSIAGVGEPFRNGRYIAGTESSPSRELEFEQKYHRELAAENAHRPVLRFIVALPTPMFLGLDRRPGFLDRRTAFPEDGCRSRWLCHV